MKYLRLILIVLGLLAAAFQPARAQSDDPLVIVMHADGVIFPAMQEYIERGIKVAAQRNADLLIIELNTPGGSVDTMNQIVSAIRASEVPVVVHVTPRGAWAASAGAFITMSAHASAMSLETVIGAASPVTSDGGDLQETLKAKEMEALTAKVRTLTAGRSKEAQKLAEAMVLDAKAVTAQEALDAGLIDFIAADTDELLEKLDGFIVQMSDGPRRLNTANARTEDLNMSFVEQLLLILTDPNIVFLLLAIGVQSLFIELGSPGGWVAGTIGVVCLSLAAYGLGILPVNWFGIILMVTAFVLFIIDVYAPTHGALTAAGIAAFVVGALVLFNSPGTPEFQRVSVPLVIGSGVLMGLAFAVLVGFMIRALRVPISMGAESFVGKLGQVRAWSEAAGQVQLGAELWSAESVAESESIQLGDEVEVVEVKGLRLQVKKK